MEDSDGGKKVNKKYIITMIEAFIQREQFRGYVKHCKK